LAELDLALLSLLLLLWLWLLWLLWLLLLLVELLLLALLLPLLPFLPFFFLLLDFEPPSITEVEPCRAFSRFLSAIIFSINSKSERDMDSKARAALSTVKGACEMPLETLSLEEEMSDVSLTASKSDTMVEI